MINLDSALPADENPHLQNRLHAARQFDEAAYIALRCEGNRIGWLRRDHAQRLLQWPRVFERDSSGLCIAERLDSPRQRTMEIGAVIDALHEAGAIGGWRDERYAVVTAFDAPPLFHIERAAARFLGVTTYAAHANGYCGAPRACEMWVARRARTKAIDPGLLDNLVGGGMSAGVPPHDTVVREAWEEAGIPAALARNAVPAGTLRLLREVPEGVQSESIFCYDLELPSDFEPHNVDGEVDEFRRLPVSEVVAVLNSGTAIALEASLVMLSFLMRRNYIEVAPSAVAGTIECGSGTSISARP